MRRRSHTETVGSLALSSLHSSSRLLVSHHHQVWSCLVLWAAAVTLSLLINIWLCLISSATNTTSPCAAPTETPTRTSATGDRHPANSRGWSPGCRTDPAPPVSLPGNTATQWKHEITLIDWWWRGGSSKSELQLFIYWNRPVEENVRTSVSVCNRFSRLKCP